MPTMANRRLLFSCSPYRLECKGNSKTYNFSGRGFPSPPAMLPFLMAVDWREVELCVLLISLSTDMYHGCRLDDRRPMSFFSRWG